VSDNEYLEPASSGPNTRVAATADSYMLRTDEELADDKPLRSYHGDRRPMRGPEMIT